MHLSRRQWQAFPDPSHVPVYHGTFAVPRASSGSWGKCCICSTKAPLALTSVLTQTPEGVHGAQALALTPGGCEMPEVVLIRAYVKSTNFRSSNTDSLRS